MSDEHVLGFNPVVAPGLLPSILLWPQDCSLQSCCGPRIAPFNPVVAPGLRGTPRGTPHGQQPKNGRRLPPCALDTPARRVIRIIRIIRIIRLGAAPSCRACPALPRQGRDSSQEKFFSKLSSKPTVSANLPGIARPRLPGIASSLHTEVGITTSLFCRKTHHRASAEGPGDMLSSQHNSRSVFSITGPAPKVCQRCCPRSIADRVFFHHSHAAVNPGVGAGLPHSILAWAQDCPTQSWRGHRIVPSILLW